MSEGGTLSPEQAAHIRCARPAFIERANVGYVVIDHSTHAAASHRVRHRRVGLEEIARDGA